MKILYKHSLRCEVHCLGPVREPALQEPPWRMVIPSPGQWTPSPHRTLPMGPGVAKLGAAAGALGAGCTSYREEAVVVAVSVAVRAWGQLPHCEAHQCGFLCLRNQVAHSFCHSRQASSQRQLVTHTHTHFPASGCGEQKQ